MKLTQKQLEFTYLLEQEESKNAIDAIDSKKHMWFSDADGMPEILTPSSKYVRCPSRGKLLDLRASGDPDSFEAAKDVIRQSVKDRWNAIRAAPQYCNIQFLC
jgi:hypothetical protein